MIRFFDRCIVGMAVGFGLGYIRRAPGTWGSLLGLPLGGAIYWLTAHYLSSGSPMLAHLPTPGWLMIGVIFVALLLPTYWIIHRTETLWQTHDDSRIVIDEIIGQAMCVAMFRPNVWTYLVAFVLFRIFDISKPGMIGWADRKLPGAWGTLMDDIIAGLITAMLMVGVYEIFTKMV